jgi:uncharacterized protein YwbE
VKAGDVVKTGDVVTCVDAKTMKLRSGVVIDVVCDIGPFGMTVWKILVDGQLGHYTDAAIQEVVT